MILFGSRGKGWLCVQPGARASVLILGKPPTSTATQDGLGHTSFWAIVVMALP